MTLFSDKRAGALVWLTTGAAVALLGWWYPMNVAERNASEDDRFGWALLVAFPFILVASGIAVWSYVRLLNALTKGQIRGSAILGILGGVLLLVTVSPLVKIARSFLR